MPVQNILIIDDDVDILHAAKLYLKRHYNNVVIEQNPKKIPFLLNNYSFDLILLDMNFSRDVNTGNEGFYWLDIILDTNPKQKIILFTAYGDIEMAVRAIKNGASDFILKPWENDRLKETIQATLGIEKEKQISNETGIIGESDEILKLLSLVKKVAPTDANILILGENGTGKDLLAKEIHKQSGRAKKAFVHADLGAISESLFESELFGHVKGAFTDAKEARLGRFQEADGGTLFLDEIGNISLSQQYKLLTVLQERTITRLGTNQSIPINIRLISATNAAIYEMATQNSFRKDLIYRLNTIEITMPPVRDRGNDILLLANQFAKNYADKYHKLSMEIDPKAANKLMKYSFPGNVRELQHTIERAVIMAENDTITEKEISFSSLEKAPVQTFNTHGTMNLGEVEKLAIEKVIEKHNGNITKAAQELGITRSALYRRLGKYDI